MTTLLESRKVQVILCGLFSILAIGLVFIFHPNFPVTSLLPVDLPFYFPVLGFVVPCWLLYEGKKQIALVWLIVIVPCLLTCNLHLLRPDIYFLWLCLLAVSISKNKEQVYSTLLFILAGMYVWTAIQKANLGFVTGMAYTLEKRILPSSISHETVLVLVKFIPLMEFVLAILCFTKFVKVRITFAILIHGGILFFLLKGGWNYSMILWNMLLIILHILLPAFNIPSKIFRTWKWYITPIIVMVFPALYFVGLWPGFASWTMYSGRIEHYRLVIDAQTAIYPPDYIRAFVYEKDGIYFLSISEWADAETGGAVCMEPMLSERVLIDCENYIKTHPK